MPSASIDPVLLAQAAALPLDAVEVVASLDSTNRELMRRAAPPPPASGAAVRLLLAVEQFAGRGRQGRSFLSDPADSLTFSLAIDHRRVPGTPPLVGLSLALGVAVAQVAARYVEGIGLKWPNDLLRNGRKCAGMLIESRLSGMAERVVIGLGVNLRLPPALVQAIGQPACGLFDGLPTLPPRATLAGEFARALTDATLGFLQQGFADTAAQWARFDVLAGREVSILEDGRIRLVGIADGLDASGALRVRTASGTVSVAVGDVSARLGDLSGTGDAQA